MTGEIFPVDLRRKRRAAELTQEELGEEFGVVRAHINRIENGVRNLPFPIALECARRFGSLTIRYNDELFTLRPVSEPGPDDEEPKNGPAVSIPAEISAEDEVSRVGQEAQELADQAQAFGRRSISIRLGQPESEDEWIQFIKKAIKSGCWSDDVVCKARIQHPEYFAKALRLSRAEHAAEFNFLEAVRDGEAA